MGIRKKTTLALRTLFFGSIAAYLDNKATREKSKIREAKERARNFASLKEVAELAMQTSLYDFEGEYKKPRGRPSWARPEDSMH